jgi:hypothetical protein
MINFLSTILPDQGIYFVTSIKAGVCRNHACRSFGEMVQKSHDLDVQRYDAFFACASYIQESYTDDDGKRRQRTGDNAGWVKSFWLDIDCGPDKAAEGKGYATINDALAALLGFIDAVGLPKPVIVYSGGGLHVYWPLTEAINKEQWLPVAKQLKALTQCPAIRLLADDARTSDVASILRPVGTHNFKPERNGAVVTKKIDGIPTDFSHISQIISKAHKKHCNGSTRSDTGIRLGTTQSAPDPETPENIARVKSALSVINPDSEYPLWRDIYFAIHALGWTCSEELARSWSKGDFI